MGRLFSVTGLAVLLLTCGCQSAPDSAGAPYPDMQLVLGGDFRMGSNVAELETIRAATGLSTVEPLLAEVPARQVTVSSFYMDTVDVTNREFAEFVAAPPKWARHRLHASLHNGRYLEHWNGNSPPEHLLDHPWSSLPGRRPPPIASGGASGCRWKSSTSGPRRTL